MDQIDHMRTDFELITKNNGNNKSWHTFKVKWIYLAMICMSSDMYGLHFLGLIN